MAMDILTKSLRSTVFTLLLISLVVAAGSGITYALNTSTQKQKVIAGAIYKFIKFIEWQDGSVRDSDSFNICLQQYDAAFEPFKTRKMQGKAIQIHLLNETALAANCHVVYMNHDSDNHVDLLQTFKNKSIVTIASDKAFASQGGIIELGNHNNRLSFAINQTVAKANQLNVGFQLLSLANDVITN